MQPPPPQFGSTHLWVSLWWLCSWTLGILFPVAPGFEHGEVSPLQYAASGKHHSSVRDKNCNSLSPVTTGSLLWEKTLGVSMMKTLPRRLQGKGTWTKVSLKCQQNSDPLTPLTGTQNRLLHFYWRIFWFEASCIRQILLRGWGS